MLRCRVPSSGIALARCGHEQGHTDAAGQGRSRQRHAGALWRHRACEPGQRARPGCGPSARARGRAWKGRILPSSRSKATASQSSTTERTPGLSSRGTHAAMSGYFFELSSLLRLRRGARRARLSALQCSRFQATAQARKPPCRSSVRLRPPICAPAEAAARQPQGDGPHGGHAGGRPDLPHAGRVQDKGTRQ